MDNLCDFILAFIIISSGVEVDENSMQIKNLLPQMHQVALKLQLLDKREIEPIQNWQFRLHNTPLTVREIQDRYEKYLNYPMLEEVNRFYNKQYVDNSLLVNLKFQNNLTIRKTIDSIHEELINDAIQENKKLYTIWDTLREVRTEYYYVLHKREQLYLLRELIGDENFYLGNLPPPYTYWHMTRE